MRLLRWLEDKFTGQLVVDYGPLSSDPQGLVVSASLRQRRNGRYYLALKWEGKGTLEWVAIEASPDFLDRMAFILQDAKARIGGA